MGNERKASVSEKGLAIYCAPEELEPEHLPHARRAIAQANDQCRYFLGEQKEQDEARLARENHERAKLEEIKQKLGL